MQVSEGAVEVHEWVVEVVIVECFADANAVDVEDPNKLEMTGRRGRHIRAAVMEVFWRRLDDQNHRLSTIH